MSQQYTVRSDKFKELKKQFLLKLILKLLMILIIGYIVFYFTRTNDEGSSESFTFEIVYITVIIVVALVLGIYRHQKRLESFKVTITESEIRREMKNTPTIRIRLENIKSISKDKLGNFVIKGDNKFDVIGILPEINDYEQLEQSLSQIKEIERNTQPTYYQLLGIISSFVMGAGMLMVYYLNNKWVVGISCAISSGIIIWSFIMIQKNKNASQGNKLTSYLMILILFSILITTYIKLTGDGY